jgi:hypothetical protein
LVALAAVAIAVQPAVAQSSASYVVQGSVLNSGGNPNGITPQSASYQISLDAIGDAFERTAMASPSYRITGGGGLVQPPAGEVDGLRLTSKTELAWNIEPSSGFYNIYRASLNAIVSSGYGSCLQYAVATTTSTDADPVAPATGFFYLVTVSNLLAQEGTKGASSNGVERPNGAPCP